MTSTTHRQECTAIATLYVALELSTKEWLLTMSTGPGAQRHRARVRPGDQAAAEPRAVRRKAAEVEEGRLQTGPVQQVLEGRLESQAKPAMATVKGRLESGHPFAAQ